MLDYDMEVVKKHGKILGQFDGCIPNLWVTDAELIKSIFIKDFDHFVDRRVSLLYIYIYIFLNTVLPLLSFTWALLKIRRLPSSPNLSANG